MKLLWRSIICTFFLLISLSRAQDDTAIANLLNVSCDPTCLNCGAFNTPNGCTSCKGDAFILSGTQGACFCQGAQADPTTCTPQNSHNGGSVVYSLMGNFSQNIASEWNYTAPIAYCNANQALLNLSAQNPNATYNFSGVTLPTHQVVVATLKIEIFFPSANPSINVTISSEGFTMTKYYNATTTGLSNGACGIGGTAFLEDTVTFSFQHTNTNPENFSVSVQSDGSSWIGVRDFRFQASNCSSNCAGSCSGPGPNQCLQCPVGSIGPVNGVCQCLDNSTILPNGTCSGVSNMICPNGCNRCSNFGNGVTKCYQCLPGYSLMLLEDGLNQLSSVCIANDALITNNHALAGSACHPSCRQCYGSSQYQCSACWANFTLTRIGDVSQCVPVTGVSADNLTSDKVVASTNLTNMCQVSWTSHKVCTAITEQYLSNLQAGHWLASNGAQQQINIQTQAPNKVCETCMLVQLVYVYPNQTTLALDYQVSSADAGHGMQNITYSANFNPGNLSGWNCPLSSNDNTTWYTCSFQLIFTTMDNSTASYDFNISSYINYYVNGSVNIVDLIGATPGTESDDTELCADAACTSLRNNSQYTNNDSAIAQVCLPDSPGNNLTLTKSNITAVVTNPNGTFTSSDVTNQVTQNQSVNCVTYTIPLTHLPVGNVTFLIQSKIVPWTGGTRRLLQADNAMPFALNSIYQTSLHIVIGYPAVKDYTPVTYTPQYHSEVPRDISDKGTTWWIVGASILGGAILVTLFLIIYMAIKEHQVRKRTARSNSRKLSDLPAPIGIRVLNGLPHQSSGQDIQGQPGNPRRSGSVEQPTTVVVPQITTLPAYIPQEPQSARIPAVKMNKVPSGGLIV